jgi:rhomboid protease GluP
MIARPSPLQPLPPPPTQDQERFRVLVLGMRRTWVAWAIVAVNVAVFAAMVASGVSVVSPSTDDALRWGASAGSQVMGGEVWRLFTANYVHFGVVHLAFNMYVLWSAGPMIERIFGHAAFFVGYAFAGFAGSVASVFWHGDAAVSAGASGAIFGIFGMMGGFLVRRRSVIPPHILAPLRNQVISFIVFNVAFAFAVRGLDQAAHLGGLAGGFGAGLLLTPELTDQGARRPWALYPVPIVIVVATTLAFALGAFGSR